jgi:hypothetical protein
MLHPVREHTFRLRLEQWRRLEIEGKDERPPAFQAADAVEELLAEIDRLRNTAKCGPEHVDANGSPVCSDG